MRSFHLKLLVLLCGCSLASFAGVRAQAQAGHPSAAAMRQQLKACGRLQHAGTRYVLQNDVQSPGTCFSIEADNITLDLNGHTATYATEEKTIRSFGVIAADCWYKPVEGNPCGGSHRRLTVMNGAIVQGPAAAPFSHGLQFGQATTITGVTVHDLTISIHAADSIAIYSEYLPGGSEIFKNTILNSVRTITSRTQFRGASIKLDSELNDKLPDRIHDNIIKGGPQLGIRTENPAGTQIYNNDISMDTVYTNGFCIDVAGQGTRVYGNNCHPVHGRGIHANHSNVVIDHNTITTVDSDQNAEYHGCEINGTYGIQLEDDGFKPTNMTVTNNKVTVYAQRCPAEAMRIAGLKTAAIQIHDNTFVALQDMPGGKRSDQLARAFSVGEADGANVKVYNNVLRADSAIFHADWDGGSSWTFEHNTFQAGHPGKSPWLAEFDNGTQPSRDIHFRDNTYQGVDASSAHFGMQAGASSYYVDQPLTVQATRGNGPKLKQYSAVIKASADGFQSTGTITSDGDIAFMLPVWHVENGRLPKSYAPYTLTIQSPGCQDLTEKIASLKQKTLQRSLICH